MVKASVAFAKQVVLVSASSFAGGEEMNWSRMGEELADALEGLEHPILIQVDELPVFALKLLNRSAPDSNQERIREFLYWLRRLRLQYSSVRWILAGSIGLDTVASRLNIADAINDLRIETLGAFDLSTSHAFLASLAQAYQLELSEAVRSHMIAKVGWPIPYYLQLIFSKLRESSIHLPCRTSIMPPTHCWIPRINSSSITGGNGCGTARF